MSRRHQKMLKCIWMNFSGYIYSKNLFVWLWTIENRISIKNLWNKWLLTIVCSSFLTLRTKGKFQFNYWGNVWILRIHKHYYYYSVDFHFLAFKAGTDYIYGSEPTKSSVLCYSPKFVGHMRCWISTNCMKFPIILHVLRIADFCSY